MGAMGGRIKAFHTAPRSENGITVHSVCPGPFGPSFVIDEDGTWNFAEEFMQGCDENAYPWPNKPAGKDFYMKMTAVGTGNRHFEFRVLPFLPIMQFKLHIFVLAWIWE